MRRFFLPVLLFLPLGLLTLFAAPASAAESKKQFFRIRSDVHGKPAALETAVLRFEGRKNGELIVVDLVSAVHVAEADYYGGLNKMFENYDAVLYELIAPEDRRVPPKDGERSTNGVSMLQGMIKNLLALEFQLDGVNYEAKNFVHADLTPDEFFNAMSERGDSIWSILARVLAEDLFPAEQAGGTAKDIKILMALLSSNEKSRAYRLRRYLAEDFGEVEDLVARLEGPSGSAIISDRNARAIAVLKEQLATGKKRFAIFYGGAHMPDMEKRLLEVVPELEYTQTRWLVAWRLQPEQ